MRLISVLDKYRLNNHQSVINKLLSDGYKKADAKINSTLIDLLSSQSSTVIHNKHIESLDPKKVYDLSSIKSLCIDYRLRFLSSSLYKAEFPKQVIAEINFIKDETKIKFDDFYMIAPAGVFNLKNYDDPLLFANLGNGYYYYITQWGNDLSKFRKLKYWPLRNLENLVTSFICIICVFILTLSTFFWEFHRLWKNVYNDPIYI